jgi:hypothetical protein
MDLFKYPDGGDITLVLILEILQFSFEDRECYIIILGLWTSSSIQEVVTYPKLI